MNKTKKILESMNTTQKIFLFLIIFNIVLGIPLLNKLELTYIRDVEDLFGFYYLDYNDTWKWELRELLRSVFWWGINFVLVSGFFIFKTKEEEEEEEY